MMFMEGCLKRSSKSIYLDTWDFILELSELKRFFTLFILSLKIALSELSFSQYVRNRISKSSGACTYSDDVLKTVLTALHMSPLQDRGRNAHQAFISGNSCAYHKKLVCFYFLFSRNCVSKLDSFFTLAPRTLKAKFLACLWQITLP